MRGGNTETDQSIRISPAASQSRRDTEDGRTACESHLREAQVEHVGVQLAQSSGEAVAAQIVSAELAEKTNSTERRLKMDAAKSTYS